MTVSVKKINLAESEPALNHEELLLSSNTLDFMEQVEVTCSVRIGTLSLTVGELKTLKSGQELCLAQKTDQPVEILLNDQVIARGELMSIDDRFAVRITELTHE